MSIPTIEEYIDAYYPDQQYENFSLEQVRRMIKGFGDICVKAALEAAFKNGKTLGITASNSVTYWSKIDEKSILNAYPLTNIK